MAHSHVQTVLVAAPNPTPPSSTVTVTGTGFANVPTRLLLDNVEVVSSFRPGGDDAFTVGIAVGDTEQTQTIAAEQKPGSSSSWVPIISTTVVVQAGVLLTISGISVGSITQTSAAATWTTNKLATAQVEYGLTTGYGRLMPLLPSAMSFSQTISPLVAGTTYHYRIRATDVTDSILVFSTDATFSTTSIASATVPGVPTGLTATPGIGLVNLVWAAPASDGGSAITGYRIYRDAVLVETPGVVLTVQETGLTSGVSYSYQVSAVNAVGEGTKSSAVTVTPTGPTYTFFDDFDTLNTAVWIHHYNFGTLENTWAMDHATVSGSILSLTATRTSPGVWVSALIDTKTTFFQKYGLFEARIKIPKGRGLWPAFWGYYDANSAEIDTMEICANPIGERSGNDASLDHTTIHWSSGSLGNGARLTDLSLAYHVYAHEWRSDHVAFFVDGVEVWRYTNTANIPAVPLPLILNLAVGGSWCGPSDATTPSPAVMLVDWVRVSA